MTVTAQPFGTTSNGQAVTRYILRNSRGMQAAVLSYGAVVQSIIVPGKNGVMRDVALGYDNISDYEKNFCFFGAFVGRYANRIKNGAFTLNGKTYRLKHTYGAHHLHGIFAFRVYDGVIEDDAVVFRFTSPPSDEGYPGTLGVELRYRLTEDNALEISYAAVTDEDTVINLTNHSYFNLNGHDGEDILNHSLQIDAGSFTEIDREGIPTGKILCVDGTALDFREEKKIRAGIFSAEEQIANAGGYDHNLVFNKPGGEFRKFAVAKSGITGITLTAYTTEPAVQLYTGNFVNAKGKGGVRYGKFSGFALEAQHYPCSPNFPEFPSTVLKKGDTYFQRTVYQFSVD